LANESGHAEKIGSAFQDGLSSDHFRVAKSTQILPGAGVVRQGAKLDMGAIGALIYFVFVARGYARQDKHLVEYFEVARPEGIFCGAACVNLSGVGATEM
jgi:hypothetical protein